MEEGLLKSIEEMFIKTGFFPQTDLEISDYVEKFLEKNICGGKHYVFARKLPLFIDSNWKTIKERIFDFDGEMKIATYEKLILPDLLKKETNLSNLLEVYKLDKEIPDVTRVLFSNKYDIVSNDGKKFLSSPIITKGFIQMYKDFFEKAEKELEKVKIEDCFR